MRLWLVIYILGKVAAVLGPLPPDEAACRALASNYAVTVDDPMLGPNDVRIECNWASHRPEGGEPLEQLDD